MCFYQCYWKVINAKLSKWKSQTKQMLGLYNVKIIVRKSALRVWKPSLLVILFHKCIIKYHHVLHHHVRCRVLSCSTNRWSQEREGWVREVHTDWRALSLSLSLCHSLMEVKTRPASALICWSVTEYNTETTLTDLYSVVLDLLLVQSEHKLS